MPKPKPRPRPIPVESARVRKAQRLVDEKLPLEALMTRILHDWPHPNPERHPKMNSWSALPLKKKAQKLQLVNMVSIIYALPIAYNLWVYTIGLPL